MNMKITKKDKKRLYWLFGAAFIFLFVAQMGWLQQYGIMRPSDYLGLQSGYTNVPVGTEVYCKITTRTLLSLSTSDLIVNMYDASGNFIDTVTTSSGVGTFSGMYLVGSSVWLQARQAAPASADPYVSPLAEYIVSSAGESADTVVLKNAATNEAILWLQDVGDDDGMVIRNGFDNNTITSTVQYINTTDDAVKVSLTLSTSNVFYGCTDFKDMITGRQYDGGVFVMWKGTVPQLWSDAPKYTFSDPTNVYYIWEISPGIFYDANGNLADRSVTAVFTVTAGNTFAADATVVIDIFDMVDLAQLGSSACLIDGGSGGITAITTKIA